MILESHPQTSVSCSVALSPELLWPFVSDISVPAQFSDELQEAEWLDTSSAPSAGAKFVGRNKSTRGYSWETLPTVSAWRPHQIFEWKIGDVQEPLATWSFELEPTSSGSILTHRVIFGTGDSLLRDAVLDDPERAESIVNGRLETLRASMQKVIDGIRELAESTQ